MPRPNGIDPERIRPGPEHTARRELILAEQVRQLYAIGPIGGVASLINSVVVFFVTREVMGHAGITTAAGLWLAAVWAVAGVRVHLLVRYRKSRGDVQEAPLWNRRFLITLLLVGAAWGSVGLFPLADTPLAYQVFLVFVLGGMAAGASSAFSAARYGYAAYGVPALLPITAHFLWLGETVHYAMAAMLLLFGVLLWRIALHNHWLNRTSLTLHFENQEMIERLQGAKEHAERLNAQLRAEIEAKLAAEAELRQHQAHLEREVEERTARLSLANKELEQFAYVASHDLKAPLRAIANLALVIDEDVSEGLDAENRGRLKLLRERAQRMDALIDAMLTYARLGQPTAVSVPIALGDVLSELLEELALPPGFNVSWQEPLPSLKADRLHLRQILQNLIVNAVQHHDRPDGHVSISARDSGAYWQLEIADDGPGIPEYQRQQVFRMFATGKREAHTGIGLAVVRKLVRGYGGEVEVLPNRPRGAVFRIAWPK